MKTEEEYKYFQFPLCLLQNILIDAENGINLIISYSIINSAKKMKYSISDVARQLIYDFYRHESELPNSLRRDLKLYVKNNEFTYDEVYNGFGGTGIGFNPIENIEELKKVFSDNKEFEQQAIFHYQIHCAANFLNVKLGYIKSIMERYEKAKAQIEEHETKYGKEPTPGIKTSLLFEFRDKKNKNENELLCALIAIRSLIGQHPYTATYKNVISMRMIGAKSKKALEECLSKFSKQKELKEVYDKYSIRYQMDKMITTLLSRKFIQSKISYGRKIYFSTKLNMQELTEAIIESKKKRNFKKREWEARKQITAAI